MLDKLLNSESLKVHFIGIGGVSMSALASMLKVSGYTVTGSDMKESGITDCLRNHGIGVYIGQCAENIKNNPGLNLVCYTAAIKEDNPELSEARKQGLFCVERCELLGAIMKKYRFPINISGTHGKTTTTSMISSVLIDAGVDPTVSVGGDYKKIGGNLRLGSNDYFVCEACEYVESFLKFHPFVSIILNVDLDHVDYYRDIEHVRCVFLKFANRTHENGFVVLNIEDENCLKIKDRIERTVYTFGLDNNADCYAQDIEYINGRPAFLVYYEGKQMGKIELSVYGEHNILNSLSVILTALKLGIDFETIKKGIKDFTGANRRFEYKGMYKGAEIIDDYAHHPIELETTLKSAQKKNAKRTFIVFQPHTYTRTRELLGDFVNTLKKAENLVVIDIYAAREKNPGNISPKDITDKIPGSKYISSMKATVKFFESELKEGDLLITVGAGDVYKIGEALAEKDC